jgi:hypothetical protein
MVFEKDLRLCKNVPSSLTTGSCEVIWDGMPANDTQLNPHGALAPVATTVFLSTLGYSSFSFTMSLRTSLITRPTSSSAVSHSTAAPGTLIITAYFSPAPSATRRPSSIISPSYVPQSGDGDLGDHHYEVSFTSVSLHGQYLPTVLALSQSSFTSHCGLQQNRSHTEGSRIQ